MSIEPLKRLPWEWIYRGVIMVALLGAMTMADARYDQRYDARYVRIENYEKDRALAAELNSAKTAALAAELSRLREDIAEMKGDVKSLLRQGGLPR